MKQIRFFALQADILPILEEVESGVPIKYVKMGVFSTDKLDVYSSSRMLPSLGVATADSAGGCESFLIVPYDANVMPQKIPQNDGSIKYYVNQLNLEESLVIAPGGAWGKSMLFYGTISTIYENPFSLKILKIAQKNMKASFTKVKAFWVGEEAMIWLRTGKRLTIAEQSPQMFDLII